MRIKWRERGRKPGLENDRRGRPREHPKGTSGHAFSRGSPMCGHVISVQKAPLERILRTPKGTTKGSRDHRSLRLTFHNVTSSQNAPLGRILRNFRLRMRTPFHPFWVMWPFRSLPVAMVLVLLYYMLYYYYSSSTKCTSCACACDHFRSCERRHFLSRHFRSRHFRSGSLPVTPPQIWYCPFWYNTVILV
jgi:hypothetical protein